MDKLLAYLNALPIVCRAEFCQACGTSEGYLRKAASVGQRLGAELCVAIERVSNGAVTRWDLRPTNWWLTWPDLIGEPDAPAVPETAKEKA